MDTIQTIRKDAKEIVYLIQSELRGVVKHTIDSKSKIIKIQIKKFSERDHEVLVFEQAYSFEDLETCIDLTFIAQKFIYAYRQEMKKRERERKAK